jgi:hypothetical protein
MEDLQEAIVRLKPLADTVVEAATALNAAMRAACEAGLSVRVEVLEEEQTAGDDPMPLVRVRVAKRIA